MVMCLSTERVAEFQAAQIPPNIGDESHQTVSRADHDRPCQDGAEQPDVTVELDNEMHARSLRVGR